MSLTHFQLATKFLTNPHKDWGKGIRDNLTYRFQHTVGVTGASGGHFLTRGLIYSYSTVVGKIIHNNHTGRDELWLTTHDYSRTSNRQLRAIGSALGNSRAAGYHYDLYYFELSEADYRTDNELLHSAIVMTECNISTILRKNRHAKTYAQFPTIVIEYLNKAVHNATHNLNDLVCDEELYGQLAALCSFFLRLEGEDGKTVESALRGYQELEKN